MEAPETKEPQRFVDGPIDGAVFKPLTAYRDDRGWLVELFRVDELPVAHQAVMAYVSETAVGVVRGPHEHCEQTDYFAFMGPGDFTLYLWDIRVGSPTWGHRVKAVVGASNKQGVIVPPGVVHAYRNTGDVPGWVFNASDRLYAGEGRRGPVDEIRHESRQDNPYQME